MSVYILGTGLSHNGSAVLLKDGKVFVGIEKERLTRKKHDGGNDADAVRYCLEAAGIGINDLDLVVQCANFEKDSIRISSYLGKRVFPENYKVPVVTISHHLAHAYSAIGTSPFHTGHTFVLDGCGSPAEQCDDLAGTVNLNEAEMVRNPEKFYCEKDSLYSFNGSSYLPLVKDFSEMTPVKDHPMSPGTTLHSIGGLYGAASKYCFGNMDDAGKLMGLAPYGKQGRFSEPLFTKKEGRIFVNEEAWTAYDSPATDFDMLKRDFGYYADVAWWVQHEVEEAVLYTLQDRITKHRINDLCYTGGVALNALTNARINRELGLRSLHIEPAAGDNGLALGCAYYGWMQVMKLDKVAHDQGTCFGKKYSANEVINAAAGLNVEIEKSDDITGKVAALLNKGKVIGWFNGEAEFGPRALGRRSILASPFVPWIRDYINREIKLREDFRPFAPAVIAEDLTTYYTYNEQSPYMLMVNTIRQEYEVMLGAVVHQNKTSRVQTVTAGAQPIFYELLSKFKKLSGVGILLNTSFNRRGMPIVETPDHALAFFMESALDYLVMDDYIISKKTEKEEGELIGQLVGFINRIGITTTYSTIDEETFLPGILIDKGGLVVDRGKLRYPGDLLHEAGHLAVMPSEKRKSAGGNIGETMSDNDAMGEEMMAIAWSYAATVHLGLPPEVVFHPDGYKGASSWYISNFTSGNYLCLPVLQWIGLCYDEKQAVTRNTEPYPHMVKWLRD